ncbi:MAG TPA: DUF3052 family protein [Oscillatoriaceae cyanobacterium]
MTPAGYSGTSLPRKLGFKPGQAAAFVNLPGDLAGLAQAEAFAAVTRATGAEQLPENLDLVHAFYLGRADYQADLPFLKHAIRPNGCIWISWPKKAARVPTDLTEDVIRDAALAGGLVDVKVCAVSETWSGLKLVIPLSARGPAR